MFFRSLPLALIVAFVLSAPLRVRAENAVKQATSTGSGQAAPTADPLPLKQVRFFAYQLQGIQDAGALDALVASSYDVLVLEPTRTDWSKDDSSRNFDTKGMLARLKASPASDGVHRKRVMAYIDIGEAENYRWYWSWSQNWAKHKPKPADWPAFIVTPDPDGWSGNFPVAFWRPEWKDIVIYGKNTPVDASRDFISVLDEVVSDGFDGIYLDWVEAYDQNAVKKVAQADGVDPAAEMIKFIGEMRAYARQRNSDFTVIQQNASELLDGHPGLGDVVDGIAQEDTWYSGASDVGWESRRGYDKRQNRTQTAETIAGLDKFIAAGKVVFTVDYTVKNAPAVYSDSRAHGYIPYCSRSSLAKLTTTPPPDLPAVGK